LQIQFQINDLDVQLSAVPNSLLIFVSGQMQMDQDAPFKFSQVFLILPNNQGGFYCHNDIFKLVF
jgi:hypothetical protein